MQLKLTVQQILTALEYSVIPYCIFRASVEYGITVSMGFCCEDTERAMILYSTETRNMQYGIMEYSNASGKTCCTASFDCVGIFRDSVLRIPCFREVRNHRPLQQKPMLTVIAYSTETQNTQYGIMEYFNAVKTCCTVNFSCIRISVFCVPFPVSYRDALREMEHGIRIFERN